VRSGITSHWVKKAFCCNQFLTKSSSGASTIYDHHWVVWAEPKLPALALELAPIRVNLIAAGFVDTPLSATRSETNSKTVAISFAVRCLFDVWWVPQTSPRWRYTSWRIRLLRERPMTSTEGSNSSPSERCKVRIQQI